MIYLQSFLLFCLFSFSLNGYADTIRLRADEWCPHNCLPQDKKPGYMIEVAQRAFEMAGHKLDYSLSNWTRAIAEARAGTIDGIVGAIPADAPDMVYHQEEAGLQRNTFFSRKEARWTYAGIASLDQVKLGIIQDYAYSEEIAAYVKAHEKIPQRIQVTTGSTALEQNIKKLQAGRIDTLIEDASVFQYKTIQMGLADKFHESVAIVMPSSKLYIGFSPKNPKSKEYAEILSKNILVLRSNGELAKILGKYGLKDWK